MFDATKILGGLMEGRQTASMPGRFDAISQQGEQGGLLQQVMAQFGGAGAGGGLGSLLGSMTRGSGVTQGGSGGFFDQVTSMARSAMGSPREELSRNNPLAVGGLGALAGAVLGGGRGALGGGLMAVLGSLAYTAYRNASAAPAGTAVTPPAVGTLAEVPGYSDPDEVQRKARLMFRAMIQACKADGKIDDAEAARLTDHLAEAGDEAEARSFVDAEIRRPVDVAGLAREVKNPAEAAEIYGASIMAIDVDSQAEKAYLATLAGTLGLQPEVIAQMHTSLNVKN